MTKGPPCQCATLEEAKEVLTGLVRRQDGGDANYYFAQLNRYLYSIARIQELRPAPCRILDIGSHYLHQSALLSLLGYEVHGIDVPLFAEAAFIRERARELGIQNHAGNVEAGDFLDGHDRSFDLILCTEMLEHITFNPVAFWRRVWQLLDDSGTIYLTTPNAFRLRTLANKIGRFVSLRGIGLPIPEILDVVTYGHHWKEYSRPEIRRYFKCLSADFSVKTRTYPDSEAKNKVLSKLLESVPLFRTNIEAVIYLRGRSTFAEPPTLPMLKASPRPIAPCAAP